MEFGIDFNDASKCWRENKKRKENGIYVYKCMGLTQEGKPCRKEAMKVIGAEYCKIHLFLFPKKLN
jgi:hypothetical protein